MKVSQNAFRGGVPDDGIISSHSQVLLDYFPEATTEIKQKFEPDTEISR